MKKLPIGIQTFSKIIKDDYLYIDKTSHIFNLMKLGEIFFLSRPRRFGKSLLISTLKSIFSGEKELFKNLFIYDKIDWEKYPIIHIDFCLIDYNTKEILEKGLKFFLDDINEKNNLQVNRDCSFKIYFGNIIKSLSEKYNKKVVILIDEYDKPIIDYITEPEKAKDNRELLRDFYGVLKGSDSYIKFIFITGVSKFSKVSIFSGLNNLRDITLSSEFATMLGYTQEELENYFADRIDEFCKIEGITKDNLLNKIRYWYNGYSWDGINRVYNPISILNLFAEKQFRNYWFQTGTPTFLVNFIRENQIDVSKLEIEKATDYLLDSYDIENIEITSLLFQTGYLTIEKIQKNNITDRLEYYFNYPNSEVRDSLLNYLFASFTGERLSKVQILHDDLKIALLNNDIGKFINILQSILSGIPYQLHLEKEVYYHSLFYIILRLMGCNIDLEILTDKGRIDGTLEFEDKIYVIEFKLGDEKSAMKQIKQRKYYEKFLNKNKKIILFGIGFKNKEVKYLIEEIH